MMTQIEYPYTKPDETTQRTLVGEESLILGVVHIYRTVAVAHISLKEKAPIVGIGAFKSTSAVFMQLQSCLGWILPWLDVQTP